MSLTHLEVLNGAHKECYWQQLPECFFFYSVPPTVGALKFNWPDHKLFTFFL